MMIKYVDDDDYDDACGDDDDSDGWNDDYKQYSYLISVFWYRQCILNSFIISGPAMKILNNNKNKLSKIYLPYEYITAETVTWKIIEIYGISL